MRPSSVCHPNPRRSRCCVRAPDFSVDRPLAVPSQPRYDRAADWTSMELQIPDTGVNATDQATTYSENHWTLQRDAADEWCSLRLQQRRGWRLRMHVGEFSVMAEGGNDGSSSTAVDELRSRLRALGWNEAPTVRVCPKPDRRGRTTLKSAPPLANALTSATRAGARTRLVARFRDAEAGSGELSPAIGGTALTDPHSAAAATTRRARRSTLADCTALMEVTIVRDPPNTSGQCLRLDAIQHLRRGLAEGVPTSTSVATIRASSRARRMVRTSGSGRSGQALSGTAALDAATPDEPRPILSAAGAPVVPRSSHTPNPPSPSRSRVVARAEWRDRFASGSRASLITRKRSCTL